MSIDWEAIEAYAEAHSSPPSELFERLDAETRATQSTPAMTIGPVGGAFLSFIVASSSRVARSRSARSPAGRRLRSRRSCRRAGRSSPAT